MGAVWSARHRAHGTRVAVKVLHPRAGTDLAEILEHEVRAVAALDHPNIVAVHDRGTVDAAAAEATLGVLEAGSPWFAMELADAGQLSWRAILPWPAIRATLLDLLAALAHAHARNVLHRDIKPGNVLFAHGGAGPVLKLTDFGMGWSWLPTRSGAAERVGGTPQYMAPEQFAGDLALQGPWTDLYAVGCLTYALVCGRTPYRGSFNELRRQHREGPFPRLEPRVPVPRGLEELVARLVARPCGERFGRAADVIAALLALDEGPGDPPTEGASAMAPVEPPLVPSTSSAGADAETETDTASLPTLPTLPAALPPGPAPVPASWRRATERAPSRLLEGVGLGLFGLRTVPMVDRDAERDELWSALVEVRERRVPRLVVLRGPTGCGKSRLAEWVCETAEELGVAVALRATHGTPGLREGAAALVARHYRLPADATPERALLWLLRGLSIEGIADEEEALQLVEVASGPSKRSRTTATARSGVVERLVRRAAGARAAVVWLDDVHADPESIALAARLARAEDLAALVVLTVADDAPGAHRVAAALDALPARVLRVGPLAPEHGRALVRGLLGVSPELAAAIEERTAGHPSFVVQLVHDWVQRGRLVPGPRGFELAEGALPAGHDALPRSITQLWGQRIATLLAGHPTWREPLLLGATLGLEIDLREWALACRVREVTDPGPLARRMLELRMARTVPGASERIALVDRVLREILFASEPPARLRELHRACARALQGLPGTTERRGRHLVDAGDLELAFRPCLDGVDARLRSGQPEAALSLLDVLEGAAAGRWADDDPRMVEILSVRAQCLRVTARLSEAVALAERAAELATGAEPRVRVLVARELATLLQYTAPGGPRLYALLDEAFQLARRHGLEAQIPALHVQRGRALEYHGRLAEAHADYAEALRLVDDGGEVGPADAEVGLANVAMKLGRHDEALARAESARGRYRRNHLPYHEAYAETMIGEIHRATGDLPAAEAAYRAVIGRYEVLGGDHAALVRANLGIVLCATERWGEAVEVCVRARREAQASGHENLVPMIDAFLAWGHAGARDWAAFDAALAGAERLPDLSLFDPDLAMAAERAGELARAAGEGSRADRALELARAVRRGLGAGVG